MQRALFALGILCLATSGCGEFSTVKKCRAVARRVNPELEAIEKSLAGKPDAKTYQAAALKYAALARELAAFDGGTEAAELDQSVSEYAGTLSAAALRTADLATALDGGNASSAALAQRELEREAKRQKGIVKRLRGECQGR